MQQSGYLLLADISGYTEFVTQTEIDHGGEILEALIKVVLDAIKAPFKVQEIEGDAVFCYALAGTITRGAAVLDLIEGTYAGFRGALDSVKRHTTCDCRACASAGNLDLKFVLHYGGFVSRDIAGHAGISGPDVILAHRLLKNRVTETSGLRAYAFLSQAAVEALALEGATEGMTAHSESYEHLGEARGHIHDLAAYWRRLNEQRSVVVPEQGAFLVVTRTVPVSPLLAWQVYTDPKQRQRWLHSDNLRVDGLSRGRYAPGTLEHCAHGKTVHVLKTLDWKPIRYLTQAVLLPFGGMAPYTVRFEELDEGTRVTVIYGPPVHDNAAVQALLRTMLWLGARKLKTELTDNMDRYAAIARETAGASASA